MPKPTTSTEQPNGQLELGGALQHLGQQLVAAGRLDEARQTLELSLNLASGKAGCHFDLGNVFYSAGRTEDAIAEYRQAVRLDPSLASAWYNLGVALMQTGGRDRDAEHAYRRALRFNPQEPETYNNLAMLLQAAGRFKEAIQYYRCAAALCPDFHEPRFNLGSLLQDIGRLDEARRVFEGLLADCPRHTEALNNLANVLTEMGLHREARRLFEAVLGIDPEHGLSRWNLGLNQLRMGEWTDGWKNYEWRMRKSVVRSSRPMWDGSALDGARIVLMAEQGMGDLLQAVRFVRSVESRGGRVTVECHRPLLELFRRLTEVERVVEVGTDVPDHDCWLPMMSLPRVLGVTPENLAAYVGNNVPYLSADPGRVEFWRARMGEWSGIRVGLAWSGNPKFRVNAKRSLGTSDVRQISQMAREGAGTPVHLFSLQKGVPAPMGARLIPLDDDPSSMDDLAAVMMNLDLVLTVDTSVAHLAGALGRPVWTMLAFHADWRWMTGAQFGSSTPWYPTMRLLRQDRQGDWSNVLEQVEAGLNGLRR